MTLQYVLKEWDASLHSIVKFLHSRGFVNIEEDLSQPITAKQYYEIVEFIGIWREETIIDIEKFSSDIRRKPEWYWEDYYMHEWEVQDQSYRIYWEEESRRELEQKKLQWKREAAERNSRPLFDFSGDDSSLNPAFW